MRKALFLDRDGVINIERGEYTFKIEDFVFNESVIDLIKYANERDYLVIVISNQGGISRGLYSKRDVESLHKFMLNKLNVEYNAFIDEVYYCSHYEKNESCLCRKPKNVMLEKAIGRFLISRNDSILVGDSQRDVECAEKSGIKAVKVDPNSNVSFVKTLLDN